MRIATLMLTVLPMPCGLQPSQIMGCREVPVGDDEHRKKRKRHGCGMLRACDDCGALRACDCDVPCGCDLMIGALLWLPVATHLPAARSRVSAPARIGVTAIRGYQRWLSPQLPTMCRLAPTCSQYGLEAVRRYGLAYGSRLGAARIKRCGRTDLVGTADPVP